MNAIRVRRRLLALIALAALGACGDDSVTNSVTPIATTLSPNAASNGQTGVAGTALATPLSVQVLDQNGAALPGATVTWQVLGSRGSLSSTSSTSDVTGMASTMLTLGTTAGVDSVVATLANGNSATFTATGTSGAFSNLVLVSGDLQSVAAGSPTQPFIVRAVDQNGNAVAGVTIMWFTTGDGVLSAASSATDASGLGQVTLTTSSTAGAYAVTASAGSAAPVTFSGSGT